MLLNALWIPSKRTTSAQAQTAGAGELFPLNNRTWRWYVHNFWELGNDSLEVFFSDMLKVWQECKPHSNLYLVCLGVGKALLSLFFKSTPKRGPEKCRCPWCQISVLIFSLPAHNSPGLLLSCWRESKAYHVWSLVTQAQFGKRNPTTNDIRGQMWAWEYEPGIGDVEKWLSALLDVIVAMWVWRYTDVLRVPKSAISLKWFTNNQTFLLGRQWRRKMKDEANTLRY